MTLASAAEEIKRSDELWENQNCKDLREQQDIDFGNWGPFEFKMDATGGSWDSVTTNSPKILANKIMSILASSWMQLYIDVDDEVRKERKSISKTEQLANGVIWMGDVENTGVPSQKKLLATLVSHAVIRGGTVIGGYWREGEDGKPHWERLIYDPFGCQWIEAGNDVFWFCYREWQTKEALEHRYKKEIKQGFELPAVDSAHGDCIQTYTFWDDEGWKVGIGKEYIDEEKLGLDYIPINIRGCGPVPYLQSVAYQNTMRWSWQSYAYNTRNIYDLMSKLLSIASTKATDSGKKDFIALYDSVKSGNTVPKLDKLSYGSGQRNNIIFLDTSKGIDFKGFVEAPGNEVVDSFLNRVRGELDIMATIDPVASGVMSRGGSGALAAELKSATLEFINFFRECVEEDLKWYAWECVRQFKEGKFENVEVEGRDRTKQKFYEVAIKPKDIEVKRFECNLVPDRLRDRIQELGSAIQEIKAGLSSVETAMVKHNLHEDPDREKEKILHEKMEQLSLNDPVYLNRHMAMMYHDQGEEDMALYHQELSEELVRAKVNELLLRKAQQAGMMAEEEEMGGGNGQTPSPQTQTGKIASGPREIIGMPEIEA